MYKRYIKRILDFSFSLLLLVLLSPLLLLTYLFVLVKIGYPVIFHQKRPGFQGKIFELYKFRTMTEKRDEKGMLLPDEQRMCQTGTFLRKTSLDELPELVNILKGDMSFVGPRPLLVQYLDRYSEAQSHRHDVKPGLTGLAQVNGRNAITWEKKFEYDLKYVQHISFWLDFKILLETIRVVFQKKGVTEEGSATMSEFMGTKENK